MIDNQKKNRLKSFFQARTTQLAITYLTIIMGLTITFSAIIYAVSTTYLNRPIERTSHSQASDKDKLKNSQLLVLFKEHSINAKNELLTSLFLLNGSVLLVGIWFSWILARQTLKPIEEAMGQQLRFISDASHEFRTPLTAMQTINEVALRRKDFTTEQAKQLASSNLDQAKKLHQLANSLLELLHAEQDQLELKPVQLKQIINDAVSTIQPQADAKQIKLIIPETREIKLMVLTKAELVSQLLRILLDNAIKYSPAKTTVRLKITKRNNELIITVADQGEGIAKQHLEHIFERFYQVDPARCKATQSGYGLGLSIAQSIDSRLNLNLAVRSKPGKGTTFSFKLPISKKR